MGLTQNKSYSSEQLHYAAAATQSVLNLANLASFPGPSSEVTQGQDCCGVGA